MRISYRKKTFVSFALAISMSLFLLGCDATTNNTGNEEAKGNIILEVVDSYTQMPLADANISIVGGPSGKTSATGEINFENVKTGSYLLHANKNGYEGFEINLSPAVMGEQSPLPITLSTTIALNKSGASIKSRLFIKSLGSQPKLETAANIEIELVLIGNFANPIRKTTTLANGEFRFDSLPELSSFALRSKEFIVAGKSYQLGLDTQSSQQFNTQNVGIVFSIPVIILNPSQMGAFQIITPSPIKLVKGSPLKIEFTSPVDTSLLNNKAIELSIGQSFSNSFLAPQISWEANQTILVIRPYQSDWKSNSTYSVTFNSIFDIQGRALGGFNNIISVTATLLGSDSLIPVTNLHTRANVFIPSRGQIIDTNILDYNTSSYRLLWNKANNDEAYDVYFRESVDSLWTFINSTMDTVITLNMVSNTLKPLARQHMVVPHNTKPNPNYVGAAIITLSDQVKPSISNNFLGFGLFSQDSSVDNTNNINTRTVTILFDIPRNAENDIQEPLDITKTPVIRIIEGGNSFSFPPDDANYFAALKRFMWIDNGTAKITLEITAGKSSMGDTLQIDLTGIKDLSGNPFEVLPKVPIIKYVFQN